MSRLPRPQPFHVQSLLKKCKQGSPFRPATARSAHGVEQPKPGIQNMCHACIGYCGVGLLVRSSSVGYVFALALAFVSSSTFCFCFCFCFSFSLSLSLSLSLTLFFFFSFCSLARDIFSHRISPIRQSPYLPHPSIFTKEDLSSSVCISIHPRSSFLS